MEVEEEKTEMSDDTDDSTDGSDEDSSDQSDVEEDAVDDAEAEKKIAQLQKAVMYFTRIIAHLYAIERIFLVMWSWSNFYSTTL